MFERFNNRARHVIVLAQENARALDHNYIGTEHLLLGLLEETDGLAAQALGRFGMSLAATRDEVTAVIGPGKKPLTGHIPFTPRAKKTLELALREALALHHGYIGTEHLLLGILREGKGVAAQIIATHADDLLPVRMAVLDLVPAGQAQRSRWRLRRGAASGAPDDWAPAGREPADREPGPGESADLHTTPAADTSLEEAARLAGSGPIGSHHLLLASLCDPGGAAARVLAALGVDLDQVRAALRDADITGTSDEPPEEAGRRHMLVRVTGDRVTIDLTDQVILGLGRAALAALGDRAGRAGEPGQPAERDPAGEAGTIPGDLPASVSLGSVWLALRDSLADIRRRATAIADGPDAPRSSSDDPAPPEANVS